MVRESAGSWSKFYSALLFFNRRSGEDDGVTAQDSFELSEPKNTSIAPFELPGLEANLRLFDCIPYY